jgi:hypothetical protein
VGWASEETSIDAAGAIDSTATGEGSKAQGKSIRLISQAVKVSQSFVQKTCKNSGPKTPEFRSVKTSRQMSMNQIVQRFPRLGERRVGAEEGKTMEARRSVGGHTRPNVENGLHL